MDLHLNVNPHSSESPEKASMINFVYNAKIWYATSITIQMEIFKHEI